jgi:DNA-binding response OmpR family regulator
MIHVLLIEDNPSDVFMVREALRKSSIPADVMIAYDGEQAVKLLRELPSKPDFILLDLNLPKSDGFTVLETFRSAGERLRVVVLTSSDREADKQRARELGALEYITKPNNRSMFHKEMQGVLERWSGTDPGGKGST